eukprot:c19992_g1_i1 orf=602-2431(+)
MFVCSGPTMKSSLRKLRDFTLNKNGAKEKRPALDPHHQHGDEMETLTTSMQVLTDMREQYDGLLSAAQSISGSSYDFSRSIHEMASYMLENFGKIGDGDTGSSFSMLGKVQYEISKLLDLYAAHVSQTIIKPTENLLRELESVEEIKQQYEEKRELYNQMRLQKPKGRRKKGDASDQQLMAIKEQLNDQATLLDLRFQSLKRGREMSLITQAAQHHMAQVHLFGKGLSSLNAVESMVEHLSNELHIDQTLDEENIGLHMNESSYAAEVELLAHDDEEESIPSSRSSSQGSWQCLTMESSRHVLSSTPKTWENRSKSAPLRPSLYAGTNNAPIVQDLDAERPSEKVVTTYALPSPTGSTARFSNQAMNTGTKAERPRFDEIPEFRRTRTGSAGNFEETRGLAGFSREEVFKQSDPRHAMAREETFAWKENRSVYHARSPSHGHSTSYSEGIVPLGASSYEHSSTPTFSYKQATRDNDTNMAMTHVVDPLYRSGPIGRSAPWGLAPSRISPCASPPMLHLSPPLISELHKLPAPPPPPPPKPEPVIAHSAPLGMRVPEPGRKSAVARPMLSSSAVAVVQKSRSIPSSVSFARNLHHSKLIKSDDSPVIESP